MNRVQRKIQTSLGPIYLVASEAALLAVEWTEQDVPESAARQNACNKILDEAERQLIEYLRADRTSFDLPLEPHGTSFQKKVWQELLKIPYGQTRSYGQVARAIHNRKAVRAVGSANGRNPLSVVIPCHRVVHADGTPGGYGGGLKIKEKLLRLEHKGHL